MNENTDRTRESYRAAIGDVPPLGSSMRHFIPEAFSFSNCSSLPVAHRSIKSRCNLENPVACWSVTAGWNDGNREMPARNVGILFVSPSV